MNILQINKIKEKVYSGLRNCNVQPDMLLCLMNENLFGNKLSLTTVVYSEYFEHPKNITITDEILFIPLWHNAEKVNETSKFHKGYEDY